MAKTALNSFFDGTMTGKREQRIYTPQSIVDALLEVWPHVAMDPCSGPDSLVPAHARIEPPENGLAIRWPRYTYVNPPYDKLYPWLEHGDRDVETIWLIPVRPHRRWWRDFIFHLDPQKRPMVCWMDPLKFHGYDATFPAPLCVAYTGVHHEKFRRAFARFGFVE